MPDRPMPDQSALIVTLPAADPVVAEHRQRMDPTATWGIRAHVTVLFPFLPADRLTSEVLDQVGEVARSVPPFSVEFRETGWFGDEVLWLAPDPDAPFRALTQATCARFPECRPYAGTVEDPIPHLTIASSTSSASPAQMRAAAADVERRLPITTTATHLAVVTGRDEPSGWSTLVEYPLGGQASVRRAEQA